MKLPEQILDFLLGFTLAKARSFLAALAIVLSVAWIVDWKINYSDFNRLERAITLTERLDALERRGGGSKEISDLRSNFRQISAAADKFYLKNGVAKVALSDLVGPEKHLRSITPVDGERYDDLQLEQGRAIMVKRPSGEVIAYAP